MLLFFAVIALVWLLATVAVVGICMAAAAGDRAERFGRATEQPPAPVTALSAVG